MNLPSDPAVDSAQAFERARQFFVEGIAHFEAGRFEQAQDAFEASLELLPGRVSTLGNLGATHIRLGRPEQALPLLNQALATDPDDIDARCQHGLALAALGRPEEALASFDAVLIREPAHLAGLYQRSLMLAGLQRYAEAINGCNALLSFDARSEAALWLRADVLHRMGRLPEALETYDRLLGINPGSGRTQSQRGSILKDMGRRLEAIEAFKMAVALGDDAELNGFFLAALHETARSDTAEAGSTTGLQAMPVSAPRRYVEALFDEYADTFDEHLVGLLGYRAHAVLVEQLLALPQCSGRRFKSALDLGCGTGLCGPLLKPHVDQLDGIDLSAQMLDKARATGVYDALVQADVNEYLSQDTVQRDLVLSADVFIYVGALEAVFGSVSRLLQPGGIFCFSVEKADDTVELQLTQGMRYAHSLRYLSRLAAQHGFTCLAMLEQPIRQDQRKNIDGLFVYLLKT